MIYVVSYDLVAASTRNYDALYSELVRLGGRRALWSQWLVQSDSTSAQLRDHLKRYLDNNDRLLVNELSRYNWASFNLMVNPNNFPE